MTQQAEEIVPAFQLQKVSKHDLVQVLALWDNAGKKLVKTGTEHFLKPLGAEDLRNHDQSRFPVLAMVDTATNRIAAVLLVTPNLTSCFGSYLPASILELPRELSECDAAVLQCLATDPGYEQKGLMRALLQQTLECAKGMGLCRVFAKVADDNVASQNLFEGRAFEKQTKKVTGTYKSRTYDAHYYAKRLSTVVGSLDLAKVPMFNGGHGNISGPASNVITFPASGYRQPLGPV